MVGGPTSLTAPLPVRISDPRLANFLGDEPTAFARLRVVREVREDESGATIRFQQGDHARLALVDANYARYLQLARRSQERRNPVGVRLGKDNAVLELVRADNDVPTQLGKDGPNGVQVFFQGHDGVFRLKADHPEATRINALLDDAIQRNAPVWFIAQKTDLTLLDILPVKSAVAEFNISFVVAPDHLLKVAEELLGSRIRCSNALRRDIRAFSKAYLDEADELKRAVREMESNAARIQIASLSPPAMIEKAKRLQAVQFPNKEVQDKVRKVANSYVLIAEENLRCFDEFKERYRDKLPHL